MSRMKTDRKPPLPKSPIRMHPRRALRSESTASQTPPGSMTKSQRPIRKCDTEESDLRPEYNSMSNELHQLAKMVCDEFGKRNSTIGGKSLGANSSSSLFERGRFYEEYSARRNERLKRKKGGDIGDEVKTPYNLGVIVESSKRRDSKKLENLRKSVSAAYSVDRNETAPRYLLRSMNKENKKPPLPIYYSEKSVLASERKATIRRVRKL